MTHKLKIDLEDFKKNGIGKVKNFLSKEELQDLKKILNLKLLSKNHPRSYFSINAKLLMYKILKFNFIEFKNHLNILNLSKKKGLNNIADRVFQKKSFLKFIDAYHSPVSNKEVLPWHTDQAYEGVEKSNSGYTNPDHWHLKFFIYLTDVGPDNGCTSYIPKSNKIGYALRKGIFEGKINYESYFLLQDFRRVISKPENKNFISKYLKDNNLIDEFIDKTNFIESNKDSKEFDFSLSAGDAIIFDEGGVHKGSKSLKNERLVLRYLYNTKK